MKFLFSLFAIVTFVFNANAQTVKILTSGTKTSLRGLSVVNDNIVWASGSGGMVAKSIDGGTTWKWYTVKGFEKTEFRDIEAFDANTAIIMGIAEPAYILKTTDGGESWKTVYKNEGKGMFLDAMDFSNDKDGVVIGDPINGNFFIARTSDGGESWQEETFNNRPKADSGEACFASSGTNIRKMKNKKEIFISGGLSSHLFNGNKRLFIPILQGNESTGANSVAFKSRKIMIAVGGDFNTKDSTVKNCFITKNGGRRWFAPLTPPHGYRSCIEYLGKNKWITCGLNGVDLSSDNGNNFSSVSKESFHTCKSAKKGTAVFFSGNNGRIGKLY